MSLSGTLLVDLAHFDRDRDAQSLIASELNRQARSKELHGIVAAHLELCSKNGPFARLDPELRLSRTSSATCTQDGRNRAPRWGR
jgi:hypothetical protein